MDPLSLLRELTIAGRLSEVSLGPERVDVVGRGSFDRSRRTAYRSQQGGGEPYDVATVALFAKSVGLGAADYFRAAREVGVQQVAFVDRKDLAAYLTGAQDSSECIDLSLPSVGAELPSAAPAKRARLEGGDAGGAAAAAAGASGSGAGAAGLAGAAPGGAPGASAAGAPPLGAEGAGAGPSAAAAAAAAAAPVPAPGSADALLESILADELQLRDRNSVLMVPGKSLTPVRELFERVSADQAAKAKAKRRAKAGADPRAAAARDRPAGGIQALPSGRYERDTQADATLRALGAGALVGAIPAAQGAGGGAYAIPAAQGAGGGAYGIPAAQGAGGGAYAIPAAAQGAGGGAYGIPAAAQGAIPAAGAGRDLRRGDGAGAGRGPRAGPSPALPAPQAARGRPIIMVPQGLTSLISMLNAPEFFAKGRYRPPAECRAARAAAGQGPPERRLSIRRTMGRPAPGVEYTITDREPRDAAEWARVAAVVCSGKAWQFKGWAAAFPGADRGDMVALFRRVQGIYLHFADERPEQIVTTWNVKIFKLARETRHRDVTVAHDVWNAIDAKLQTIHSGLAY